MAGQERNYEQTKNFNKSLALAPAAGPKLQATGRKLQASGCKLEVAASWLKWDAGLLTEVG